MAEVKTGCGVDFLRRAAREPSSFGAAGWCGRSPRSEQRAKKKKKTECEVDLSRRRWAVVWAPGMRRVLLRQAEAAKTAPGIKILGSGCAKCNALEEATRTALAELGMETSIDHITDFAQIAAYGVMTTPALVVDGKVVSYGKVLKADEAKALIQKARG